MTLYELLNVAWTTVLGGPLLLGFLYILFILPIVERIRK